jgi:hypothetical protein
MSSRIRTLQLSRRWLTFGSSLALGGCAMHGADHSAIVARVPSPAVPDATSPAASYVVGTPSFALVASSEAAKEESMSALGSTAISFRRLFGERPAQIGVVVLDTTEARPEAMPMPSAQLTTITLTGGGLAGAMRARAAAGLKRELRFLAANAWLGEYAASWSSSLEEQGITFQRSDGRPVPPARQLPDWLHVASLRLLADSESPSVDVLKAGDEEVLPLRDLFAATLSPGVVAGVELWLRDRDEVPADTDASQTSAVVRRRAALFGAQSASVLEYLRETRGERVVAELVAASVGGLEMPEILASLGSPTSPEELDLAWRAWLRQRPAAASSPESP